MRFALQVCGWALGLPLEVLVIAALLRSGYRRFPFVFLYVIVDFLTTVLEIPDQINYSRGITTATTPLAPIWWIDEGIEQVLVYVVVLSFIYAATRHLRSRRILRFALIAGACLIAAVSFSAHYTPGPNWGIWLTPWTRDLTFCSVILDLGLWALLIGSRSRDPLLLLLSGGLGIKFTGESIGESVRQLAIKSRSRPISLTGSAMIMLANLFFLWVWWHALRVPETKESRPLTMGGSLKLP